MVEIEQAQNTCKDLAAPAHRSAARPSKLELGGEPAADQRQAIAGPTQASAHRAWRQELSYAVVARELGAERVGDLAAECVRSRSLHRWASRCRTTPHRAIAKGQDVVGLPGRDSSEVQDMLRDTSF